MASRYATLFSCLIVAAVIGGIVGVIIALLPPYDPFGVLNEGLCVEVGTVISSLSASVKRKQESGSIRPDKCYDLCKADALCIGIEVYVNGETNEYVCSRLIGDENASKEDLSVTCGTGSGINVVALRSSIAKESCDVQTCLGVDEFKNVNWPIDASVFCENFETSLTFNTELSDVEFVGRFEQQTVIFPILECQKRCKDDASCLAFHARETENVIEAYDCFLLKSTTMSCNEQDSGVIAFKWETLDNFVENYLICGNCTT